MSYADVAMYHAKQNGRGCHSVFEPHMLARILQPVNAEPELPGAPDRQLMHEV